MPVSRRHLLGLLGLLPLGVTPLQSAPAAVSSLPLESLDGSARWPKSLRDLLTYALSLTKKNLTYQFGSAEPADGGMDCSGTIYHVLRKTGIKDVPRQSDSLYLWAKSAGNLTAVTGTPELSDPVLAKLKPGDLLFWTGTYETGDRAVPVSHVMMYLGKTTAGKPVMFGASDGRPYEGKRCNGVSVFDFRIPRAEGKARFVGYSPIPGFDVRQVPAVPPG